MTIPRFYISKLPDPVGEKREKTGSETLDSHAINIGPFDYTGPQKSFRAKIQDPVGKKGKNPDPKH